MHGVYSRASIGLTWEGFDELDEVAGDGSAELLDDGSIEIEFAYHTTATKPFSKPSGILLQQPAKAGGSWCQGYNWGYMRNRWPRDKGLRLDHFLLSPELAKAWRMVR
jgi:hypothetical protein